ncbi:TRAP transporter small permease subunit [Ectopseudomonas toyotomiensis]|uniref:TRAP transporter small permease subunit n=1 Tax=Ectopseudomonas toyotomiensis TaxID=554344 RepID=UPI0018C3F824|nr:TRAP transporter small permease [Pseudomonas toyotomiensis]MBG0843285.1 TRAP transporter small permease [Pseudomonas toyotomiensis]
MNNQLASIHLIARASAWVGGITLLACAFLISLDLILRKLFGISMGGADEIAGYVLAIVSSWALPIALLKRSHIRVDILYSRLPLKPKVGLDLLALAGMAIFVGALLWHSGQVLLDSIHYRSVSTTPLQVTLWMPQSLWFAGYLFFAVTILVLAWASLMQIRQQRLTTVSALIGIHSVEEEIHEEVPGRKGGAR